MKEKGMIDVTVVDKAALDALEARLRKEFDEERKRILKALEDAEAIGKTLETEARRVRDLLPQWAKVAAVAVVVLSTAVGFWIRGLV